MNADEKIVESIENTPFFDQAIEYLKVYKYINGHCRVPKRYKTEDGFALGDWVGNRRRACKLNRLSDDTIKFLEDLGFIWDVKDAEFIENAMSLKAYKKEKGSYNITARETFDGKYLGQFVSRIKKKIREEDLSKFKTKILKDIGFIEN
jgi:uncharacterized protein YjiS (DUF1127 family)